jgi:CHAT domain-containing protein
LVLGRSQGGRLPYAVQEAHTVADLLSTQAFLEEAATQARLREGAPGCCLIHLATHGAFRADAPLFSGLALADGWLSTLDIFDLRLSASLVTLSACQTGRNVVGGGDELLGLMRAFLYAGAASVLLSQWAIQDQAAAQLMKAFYTKLTEGWTKGAALQHAQRALIGKQEEDGGPAGTYAHPYFWAPFFLVGDAGTLANQ